MKRIISFTAVLLVFSFLLTACGGSSEPVSEDVPASSNEQPSENPIAEQEPEVSVNVTIEPITMEEAAGEETAVEAEVVEEAEMEEVEPEVEEEMASEDDTAVTTGELATPDPTCVNAMAFIADVTITDGTIIESGEDFVKTWSIKNVGNCTWDERYFLMQVEGDQLHDGPPALAMPVTVKPGQTVELSLTMTAPEEPGEYGSDWKILSPQGTQFGIGEENFPFWVRIVSGDSEEADNTDDLTGDFEGTASISGFVWQDKNENNLVEDKELMEDIAVLLGRGDECRYILKRTLSDEDGRFTIENIAGGNYCLIGADGSTPLVDIQILVSDGQALTGVYLPLPVDD